MRDLKPLELDFNPQRENIHDLLKDGTKESENYRNYEENAQTALVRETYKEMHEKQTVEFVKKQHEKWLKVRISVSTLYGVNSDDEYETKEDEISCNFRETFKSATLKLPAFNSFLVFIC